MGVSMSGGLSLGTGLVVSDHGHFWSAYLVNLTFFMGLSCGAVILSVIFQIVRAKWPAPISRVAEASVSFSSLGVPIMGCDLFRKRAPLSLGSRAASWT